MERKIKLRTIKRVYMDALAQRQLSLDIPPRVSRIEMKGSFPRVVINTGCTFITSYYIEIAEQVLLKDTGNTGITYSHSQDINIVLIMPEYLFQDKFFTKKK